MKDINIPLREATFAALSLTGEAVYYMQAPDGTRGNYIVFSGISSTPIAMKSGETKNVNQTVTIYTEGEQYNDGNAADIIAGKVLEKIELLDIDPVCQIVSTEMVNDRVDSVTMKNQFIAIDRAITFQHKIYVR